MEKVKTTVEINGRKYDTKTGQVIGGHPKKPVRKLAAGTALDIVSPKKRTRPAHAAAQPLKHLKAQRAQTLARTAVTKPEPKQSNIHSKNTSINNPVLPVTSSQKAVFGTVPAQRLARANKVAHSKVISRFGSNDILRPKVSSELTFTEPPASSALPEAPPTLSLRSHASIAFDSLVHAENHARPKVKKQSLHYRASKALGMKPLSLSILTGLAAASLLLSFFAYQNIPSIAIRVAAQRSGFNGQAPTNIPPGFSFKGPILYSKGLISIKYKSNSDARNFEITQTPTNLNSESLATSNFVDTGQRYATYHNQGLTVYVFDGSSAKWVDKGILYHLSGNGELSSDQILDIAGSM